MPLEGEPFAISKCLAEGSKVHEDNHEVGSFLVKKLREKLNHAGRGALYTTNFFTDRNGIVRPIGERPPHRASAPGDPPAPDTHRLQESVDFNARRLPDGAEVNVGTPRKEGVFTEYGTRNMLARPWFRPTMLAVRNMVTKPWAQGIERRERMEARRLGGRG